LVVVCKVVLCKEEGGGGKGGEGRGRGITRRRKRNIFDSEDETCPNDLITQITRK
jgi:hypothetical protein